MPPNGTKTLVAVLFRIDDDEVKTANSPFAGHPL